MLGFAPLPLIDDFLIQYSVGQALVLLFVLSLPAGLLKGSRKISSINATAFGLLFLIVPSIGGGGVIYAFLGVALLVIGPVLYATAER